MEIIRKPLTKTDIEKRLAIPTDSLPELGFTNDREDHFVDLPVKDSTGKVWWFRCSTRLKGNHPKPYLSSGWIEFVQTKHLRINDRVYFYKEDDEATGARFKIRVERHMFPLFGQDIWVDVEQLH